MNTPRLDLTNKAYSFRVEREFGLIVGAFLRSLTPGDFYRGKFVSVSQVILVVGMVLMLLGLRFPRSLVHPNRAWMLLAEALAYVSTHIILGLVFFFIVTPIGVVKRLLGWDPLHRRAGSCSEDRDGLPGVGDMRGRQERTTRVCGYLRLEDTVQA
jgi:hypothetical protein